MPVLKEIPLTIDKKCFKIIFIEDEQNPMSFCNETEVECDIVIFNIKEPYAVSFCNDDYSHLKELSPGSLIKLFKES